MNVFEKNLKLKLNGEYWFLKAQRFKSILKTFWYKIRHLGSSPIILQNENGGSLVISKRRLRDLLLDWANNSFKKKLQKSRFIDSSAFPLDYLMTQQYAEFLLLKKKLGNILVNVFLKSWKKQLYRHKFLKIWNFEDVREYKEFKDMKVCHLCFTRISCRDDLSNIQRWEKAREELIKQGIEKMPYLGVKMPYLVLCYTCQKNVFNGVFSSEVIERYLQVRYTIAAFYFMFYLAVLGKPSEKNASCPPFEGKFKYQFGMRQLSLERWKKWCPMKNERAHCNYSTLVGDAKICNGRREGRHIVELF